MRTDKTVVVRSPTGSVLTNGGLIAHCYHRGEPDETVVFSMAPGYGWISGPEPAEHLERSGIGFGTLTVLAGSLSVTMDNETHPIVGPLPVFGKTIGIHTDELTQFKLSGRRPLAHGSATSTCPVRAYVRITGNPVPLVYCGEPTPPHAPAIIVQFAL